MDRYFKIIALPVLFSILTGCATVGYIPPESYHKKSVGVYHKVQKGETLWRIAKTYQVDIDSIVQTNRIPDVAKIGTGQLLFIPGVTETREAPPLEEAGKDENGFMWPAKGKVVSFYRSEEGDIKNSGIDIEAEANTAVLASRSGKVSFYCDDLKGYGKTVIVEHGDGFSTIYTHNAQVLVTVGQQVKRGQLIAKVGSTGRTSTPKLHFEIRREAKSQNPFHYLP